LVLVAQIAQVHLVLVKVQAVQILYLAQLHLLVAVLLVVAVEHQQIMVALTVVLVVEVEKPVVPVELEILHQLLRHKETTVELLAPQQVGAVVVAVRLLLVRLVQQAATVERELHRLLLVPLLHMQAVVVVALIV
jgi:hypothetical protein